MQDLGRDDLAEVIEVLPKKLRRVLERRQVVLSWGVDVEPSEEVGEIGHAPIFEQSADYDQPPIFA